MRDTLHTHCNWQVAIQIRLGASGADYITTTLAETSVLYFLRQVDHIDFILTGYVKLDINGTLR